MRPRNAPTPRWVGARAAIPRDPGPRSILVPRRATPGRHPPVGGALWPDRAGGQGGRTRGTEERTPMSEVRDNPARSRFEMVSGGAVAFVEYERTGGGRIALLHT